MDVRDAFEADEVIAWQAFFDAWDANARQRELDADHAKSMGAVARALT